MLWNNFQLKCRQSQSYGKLDDISGENIVETENQVSFTEIVKNHKKKINSKMSVYYFFQDLQKPWLDSLGNKLFIFENGENIISGCWH